MNEHEQNKRDKSTAIANETFAKGKAAVDQSALAFEQSYSVTLGNIRAFNTKIIDMAQANTDAVFNFALQIAAAKTPSDVIVLWPEHARKQFEMLSEQVKELTALGQKMTGESTMPISRSVNQIFKMAS